MSTTRQLAELVEAVVPAAPRRGRGRSPATHAATRTFQALRIAVNRETEGLDAFVKDAVRCLAPRGRMAVISFHGGEDHAVKHALADLAGRCTCPPELPRCACGRVQHVQVLTRRPRWPSEHEVAANPRARSARLRAAERVAAGLAGEAGGDERATT